MGDPMFMWDGSAWMPLGGGGGGFKGEWSPSRGYGAGDVVTYDGHTWATEAGADVGIPPGSTAVYEPLVALDLHNDMIANAAVVPPGLAYDPQWDCWSYDSGKYFSTTGTYGHEPGEPNATTNNLHTAWWTFTPIVSSYYNFSTYGPDNSETDDITYEPWGSTNMYLYSRAGTGPIDFSQLTLMSNNGSQNNRSWFQAYLDAGTQYYISVGYYKGNYHDIPIEYRLCVDAYALGI